MIKYQQGRFIDGPEYSNWSDTEKEIADKRERCIVRTSPKGNAICQCNTPENAIWIAQRLNMAAEHEQNSKCKYLLFSGNDYYPKGGGRDLIGGFESVENALKAHNPKKYDYNGGWAEILCIENLNIVKNFNAGSWHDGKLKKIEENNENTL